MPGWTDTFIIVRMASNTCLLSLLMLFVCGLKSIEGCECAKNLVKFEGSCYLISTDRKSFAAARQQCQQLGGDLAIISCEDENTFLKGETKKGGGDQYFVGGTDEQKEAEWKWINGDLVVFKNWGPGEPNNLKNNEHCMTLMKKFGYRWNDTVCKLQFNYICEVRSA